MGGDGGWGHSSFHKYTQGGGGEMGRWGVNVSIDTTYHNHQGNLLKGGDILCPIPEHGSLGVGFFMNLDPETGRTHTPEKIGLSNVYTLVEDKQGMGMCL